MAAGGDKRGEERRGLAGRGERKEGTSGDGGPARVSTWPLGKVAWALSGPQFTTSARSQRSTKYSKFS